MGNIFSSIGNAVSGAVDGAVHDVVSDTEGVVHGAEHVVDGAVNQVKDLFDGGAQTAALPSLKNPQPPTPVQPHTWQAPSVASSGHIKVHHGALIQAADVIQKYLSALQDALQQVNQNNSAFHSLMSWSTGAQFGGNMQQAVTAFHQAGQKTHDVHTGMVSTAKSTAQTYSDVEATNARAVSNINASGGPSSGASSSGGSSSAAASGSWS
jgi:hypothetical protein